MTDNPDMLDLDARDDDMLDADIAALRAARAFADAMTQVRWFTEMGEDLYEDAEDHAAGYVNALGFPDTMPLVVQDVEEAIEAASNLEVDTAAFEAEEQLRLGLVHECLALISEDVLRLALTQIDEASSRALDQAMPFIVDHWQISDDQLIMAMMGAAIRAAHGAGLVLIAKALLVEDGSTEAADDLDDHAFHHGFGLYIAGRWPIGITGMSLNIF